MRFSEQKQDFTSKIIILGDSGVGKTSILMRLCYNIYSENFITTIGMDFKTKTMRAADNKVVKLLLWDTAGQQKYKVLTKSFYNGVSGIVLVYSVNDRNSFHNIKKWIKQIDNNVNQNVELMILANKYDIKNKDVTNQQGQQIAREHSAMFMEVSAKSSTNINEAFERLAKQLRPKRNESIYLTNSIQSQKKPMKSNCC